LNYELTDQIEYYLGKDQEILSNPRFIDNKNKLEKDSLLKQNIIELMEKVDTSKFPLKSEIGTEGIGALHILFLHMDYWPLIQFSIGNKMLSLGSENGYSEKDAAYIIDRSLRNMKKPQLYGTILITNKDGKRELYPVDDLEKVKERREKLGFQSLNDYFQNLSITK
jgi:hypothetical protein